jgi:hypothetical protein
MIITLFFEKNSNFFAENRRKSLIIVIITLTPSWSGANPTIASYNASSVNISNAMNSLVRFENKNIIFYSEKTFYPTTNGTVDSL